MARDNSGIAVVTFDKTMAAAVIDALQVDTCRACNRKITRHSYGGSVKLRDGVAHFHNSLPCLLQYVKERENV